jgi:hypothetical protein
MLMKLTPDAMVTTHAYCYKKGGFAVGKVDNFFLQNLFTFTESGEPVL